VILLYPSVETNINLGISLMLISCERRWSAKRNPNYKPNPNPNPNP